VKICCRDGQDTDDNMCLRTAWWIPKATNTHSQCVILIACSLQLFSHERASILRETYVAFLVAFD